MRAFLPVALLCLSACSTVYVVTSRRTDGPAVLVPPVKYRITAEWRNDSLNLTTLASGADGYTTIFRDVLPNTLNVSCARFDADNWQCSGTDRNGKLIIAKMTKGTLWMVREGLDATLSPSRRLWGIPLPF